VHFSEGSKHVLASRSQVAAGGDRWLLTAVRGHLGDTSVMRRPVAAVASLRRPSPTSDWVPVYSPNGGVKARFACAQPGTFTCVR
jgi:hypothetical protein